MQPKRQTKMKQKKLTKYCVLNKNNKFFALLTTTALVYNCSNEASLQQLLQVHSKYSNIFQ